MFLGLSGCSSGYFIYQAAKGQLKILNRGKPLEQVIEDPRTDPKLVELLKRVPEFKKFGETQGLKPTKNYQEYVKLDHEAASYVVTVAHRLKMEPEVFTFPIAGSFNYLGWFHPDDAREFAKKYSDRGFDVDLRGASAFSTLGWFRDPILSSMIYDSESKIDATAMPDLLNVVLHESVHATVYIEHQTSFNEALASFIADRLTEEFYRDKTDPAYVQYQKNREWSIKVRQRFQEAYRQLESLYGSSRSDEEKLAEKKRITEKLQGELKFKRPINNATLIQFKTYDPSDQGFEALFERSQKSIPQFLERIKKIQPSDFERLGCVRQCEKFKSILDAL